MNTDQSLIVCVNLKMKNLKNITCFYERCNSSIFSTGYTKPEYSHIVGVNFRIKKWHIDFSLEEGCSDETCDSSIFSSKSGWWPLNIESQRGSCDKFPKSVCLISILIGRMNNIKKFWRRVMIMNLIFLTFFERSSETLKIVFK